MIPLEASVAAFCERHALLPPGATVVVAVSGGPDSLALLHVLRALAPSRQLRLHVAHLDHALRPESPEDARFVAETAAAWALPCTVARADIAQIAAAERTGVEATARAVRLRFLAATAQSVGASAVATGHTADDQAETVLLRLLRGAGPSGLAAMRPARPISAEQPMIKLVRPLLDVPRAEVERYCAAHGLQPRHDPSNDLPIYLRNSMRGYILPLLKTYNSSIVATLGRTARICADEDDLIESLVADVWPRLATVEPDGVRFERGGFAAQHPALQRRLLRRGAAIVVPTIELEARHVDLALGAIRDERRRVQLPGGLWLVIRRTALRLTTAA